MNERSTGSLERGFLTVAFQEKTLARGRTKIAFLFRSLKLKLNKLTVLDSRRPAMSQLSLVDDDGDVDDAAALAVAAMSSRRNSQTALRLVQRKQSQMLLRRKLPSGRVISIDTCDFAMLNGGAGIAHLNMNDSDNRVKNLKWVKEGEARKMLMDFEEISAE